MANDNLEDGIPGIDDGESSLDKRDPVHAIAVRQTDHTRERFRRLPVAAGKGFVQDVISATRDADGKRIGVAHLPR